MQVPNKTGCEQSRRNKLGLALAGGGFRASLFHLGVLHRMAELDLLRFVEVLSTVSGGSIIGALYTLLLKKEIDTYGTLSQQQYMDIVNRADEILVQGIKKNLRTRLFMNPLGILRVLTTNDSLGRRMARIYERYIYKEAVENLIGKKSRWHDLLRPGRFLLRDLPAEPGGKKVSGGFESYNRRAVFNCDSVITHLVLNATSLNSGAPFWFSTIEIGDPVLGLFRCDEIKKIMDRKEILMEMDTRQIRNISNKTEVIKQIGAKYCNIKVEIISLALWWKEFNKDKNTPFSPQGWNDLSQIDGFPGNLTGTDFGQLRAMKLCAWYIRIGANMSPPVYGGLTIKDHTDRFWNIFDEIDEDLAKKCQAGLASGKAVFDTILDFILEFYYIRSADAASKDIRKHYNELRVGEAVGASACFPPVFPPFIILGIYDDLHVARLGLTDGGVYDNVGITALVAENCNYIIASDTSGLFDIEKNSSTSRLGMIARIISVLMNNIASAQRKNLREKRRETFNMSLLKSAISPLLKLKKNYALDGLAFFHINSPSIPEPMPGEPMLDSKLDRKLLAEIRTDLDGFGDIEIAALVNHGYTTADMYIRKYLNDSPYVCPNKWKKPVQVPKDMSHCSHNEIEKVLEVGHSRFFRSLKLCAPVSLLFALAVPVLSIVSTWKNQLSVKDIIEWIAHKALISIDSILPAALKGWTSYRVSLGMAAAVIAVMIALLIFSKCIYSPRKKVPSGILRRCITALKWGRAVSGNVLWPFNYMPVFIALAVSAFAFISHLVFYLPFKIVTSIPKTEPPKVQTPKDGPPKVEPPEEEKGCSSSPDHLPAS